MWHPGAMAGPSEWRREIEATNLDEGLREARALVTSRALLASFSTLRNSSIVDLDFPCRVPMAVLQLPQVCLLQQRPGL